jgi:hypothetical protein
LIPPKKSLLGMPKRGEKRSIIFHVWWCHKICIGTKAIFICLQWDNWVGVKP